MMKKQINKFKMAFALCFILLIAGCEELVEQIYPPGELSPRFIQTVETKIKIFTTIHPPEVVSPDIKGESILDNELTTSEFFSHPVHQGGINDLVVTQDGLTAFTGGDDGSVISSRLLGNPSAVAGSVKVKTEVLLQSSRPILALSLSPDQNLLAVAQFSSVVIYNIKLKKITHQLTRVVGRITALAWDPKGELLALGTATGDIFVWLVQSGSFKGQDNWEALEKYAGGTSAIVKIVFHPSARAFFVAEQEGVVSFWRLLRTERNLGLRDEHAVIDKKDEGTTRKILGVIPAKVEDLWLDLDLRRVNVAAADGYIYLWKIRGLKSLGVIHTGKETITSLAGIELNKADQVDKLTLLVVSTRAQRLQFWCSYPNAPTPGTPTFGEIFRELPNEPKLPGLVFRSPAFVTPISVLRSGNNSSILWASQKTGNLLTFDIKELTNLKAYAAAKTYCNNISKNN